MQALVHLVYRTESVLSIKVSGVRLKMRALDLACARLGVRSIRRTLD